MMKIKYFSKLVMCILIVSLTSFLISQDENGYEQWKTEQQATWQKEGTTSLQAKASDLISSARYWLNVVKKDPSQYSEQRALYNYNYARELLEASIVSRWQDIDESWLDKQGYALWKAGQQEQWQKEGMTSLQEQTNALINSVYYWLNDIKKDPQHSQYSEQRALYNYNYAREILGAPVVSGWQDIDESWLDQEGYKVWKETEQGKWQKQETTTLLGKLSSLMFDIKYALNQLSQTPSDTSYERKAIYAYNFLRELLYLNPVDSFSQLDKKWLDQVDQELEPYAYREKRGYTAPTFGQTQLLEQAQKMLKLKQDILASSYEGAGASGWIKPGLYSVAFCSTPDVDTQLASLYHELGHIVHKDSENLSDIITGTKTYEQYLKDVRFKRARDRVDKYLGLGKKAFDKSTPVGRHVVDILTRYPKLHFWNAPENIEDFQRVQYLRQTEQRADLFEIEKLLENQQLGAILQDIVFYAYESVIANTFDDHPSGFERALYMTGFLVDNKIDVNKAFRQWYATGKCTIIQPGVADLLFPIQPKSQGAQDLIKAYKRWQEEQERNKYEQWKAEQQKEWEKAGKTSLKEQVKELINDARYWLKDIKKDPEHGPNSEQRALYNYNYARELLGASIVASWQGIDESWLDEQGYKAWKEAQQEEWEHAGKTSLQDRVEELINQARYWLKEIKKDPEHGPNSEQRALYNYNYARELLGASIVPSWQDIDESWLDEQGYKAWKEAQQEKWQETGKTSLQDQVKEMIGDAKYWLKDIKKDPKHSQNSEQQALYSYNYARELMGASIVSKWQDIDESWLDEQGYKAWKEAEQEEWEHAGKTSLQDRVKQLMRSARYWLEDIKKDPEHSQYSEQQALYNYNYARELLGESIVSKWQDINEAWLETKKRLKLGQ